QSRVDELHALLRRELRLAQRRFVEQPLEAPVAALLDPKRAGDGAHCDETSGRRLANALEDAVRRWYEIAAHEQRECVAIDLIRPGWMTPQRLELGPEQQRVPAHPEVQRLLAETIARQVEDAFLPVPQRESEHSTRALDSPVHAPAVDGGQQHLGVGAAAEQETAPQELAPQLREVVDLAVVDDRVPATRRRHRLMSVRRQIDDRQSAMPQRDPGVRI